MIMNTALFTVNFSFFQSAEYCPDYPVTSYSVVFTSGSSSPTVFVVDDPLEVRKSQLSITVTSSNGLIENTQYNYHIIAANDVGTDISTTRELCTLCWKFCFISSFDVNFCNFFLLFKECHFVLYCP